MKKKLLCLAWILGTTLGVAQNLEDPAGAHIPQEVLAMDAYYEQLLQENEYKLENLKGTGYMPYVRGRYFYEMRRNMNGELDLAKRWETFKKIRSDQGRMNGGPLANWENIGPTDMDGHGGRMISHAFDPNVADVLWVGSASGGLWLTEDAGQSWEPMTNDIPSTGVGAVAVHPTDSDILIIGTGEGFAPPLVVMKGGIGVFRSLDRGLTWLPTSLSYDPSLAVSALKLAWNPNDPNIVWLAATNGLFKSEDMGANWTQIFGDGTNHGNFIFDDIIIQQDNPDIMFVSQENVGIWKSTDGGDNFTLLGGGLPATDINFISIDQSTNNPNVLYASITKLSTLGLEGLYRSNDNGDTWTRLDNTPDAFCNAQGICQGWYDNTVGVSPDDPDIVIFGGISFWQSEDGGVTWTQKDRTACVGCGDTPACATYVDHHDIGFDPHVPNRVFSFNDGGVSRSADNGNCWDNANDGLVTAQFLGIGSGRTNTSVVIGGLQDHGLQGMNLDNGQHWERWGFFDGVNVSVDPTNELRFFGTWIDGTYWRALNGTNTFATPINVGIDLTENTGAHFAPLRQHPTDPSILLGSTQQGLYRTDNFGNGWSKRQQANVITDVAFSQHDPDRCYAASWNGTSWFFFRSDDTGMNWEFTNSSPGWRVTDIKTSGLDKDVVFASRNSINPGNPHIYKSVDGGDTWISLQGDLPDMTVNAIAVNHGNDDIIYAATDLGVFITENGGQNWFEFNEGLAITFVNDIEYNPVDHKVRIGTLGRGVWISDAWGLPLGVSEISKDITGITVFPNPAESYIEMNIASTQDITNARIEVLNYLGQRVATLYEGDLNTTSAFQFKLPQLSSGLYFVRLVANKRGYTEKLMIR
ncbi:T9SS type A sorting domain-containing protein [Aureisphaera galaxeae]|uniref:T9SS type A sorting domain-containing protein n=1 Tax=Aureisphaera galaxeae TaxID=1538023 RepID=UPI0023507B37|nr:T9SS type A sorting domain-containing protein [Aureisphaera galaxeae]MDC8005141.1 T9SS type A sorting domain-containing protein [Aureisphaera galaxeae]